MNSGSWGGNSSARAANRRVTQFHLLADYGSPSPRGRGRGEGEGNTRTTLRVRIEAWRPAITRSTAGGFEFQVFSFGFVSTLRSSAGGQNDLDRRATEDGSDFDIRISDLVAASPRWVHSWFRLLLLGLISIATMRVAQ